MTLNIGSRRIGRLLKLLPSEKRLKKNSKLFFIVVLFLDVFTRLCFTHDFCFVFIFIGGEMCARVECRCIGARENNCI